MPHLPGKQGMWDDKTRTPWNNIIFPGNYVAHLNAYRNQGVTALPGYNFFRLVGALVLKPENNCVPPLLDPVTGLLPAGTYDLKILSPDLRPDDKPRLDRPFVVPAGAFVYRTAVNSLNMQEIGVPDAVTGEITFPGTPTITVEGVAPAAILEANQDVDEDLTTDPITKGSVADGYFPTEGAWEGGLSIFDGATEITLDTPIQVTTSEDLKPHPYCGGGSGASEAPSDVGQSAILVEVCFFMEDAGPDADDVHLPYPIEAGQGY